MNYGGFRLKRGPKNIQTGNSVKLWGGRFTEQIDPLVAEFSNSIRFDVRLAKQDLRGSIAYAKALCEAGIYSIEELGMVTKALEEIATEIDGGKADLSKDEDIHSAIERLLTEKTGDAGAKLHSGRSRNDQVVTDLRMYVMEEIENIKNLLSRLQDSLVLRAEEYKEYIIPGYTHLQRAQPVLLGHHLMAYFWMLQRDKNRLFGCYETTSILPLGSGALSGSSIPVNRQFLASELGFRTVGQNSMDMSASRDFAIEMASSLAIIQMHLSRMAEEIILWTSSEFSFAELPDNLATGSSMMPQKKNPDIAELVRGKFGRVQGSLVGLLSTMKALPLCYNRDMQEDKEGLFDSIDTVKSSLHIMSLGILGLQFNKQMLDRSVGDWQLTVTDLMESLVLDGVPLRQAHEKIGKLVRHCISNKISPDSLTDEELKTFSDKLSKSQVIKFTASGSINAKQTDGSTSLKSLDTQLNNAKGLLSK